MISNIVSILLSKKINKLKETLHKCPNSYNKTRAYNCYISLLPKPTKTTNACLKLGVIIQWNGSLTKPPILHKHTPKAWLANLSSSIGAFVEKLPSMPFFPRMNKLVFISI